MKREKTIVSSKVLKSRKNMAFIERRIVVRTGEIRDYFFHKEERITLIRHMKFWVQPNGNKEPSVFWTCPELGGGVAGLGWWLRSARMRNRSRHHRAKSG